MASDFGFHYDKGCRKHTPTSPNSGVMTTYDAETFSAADYLTVIGYHKEALQLCGAKDVRVVEEESRACSASFYRYRFSWRMRVDAAKRR